MSQSPPKKYKRKMMMLANNGGVNRKTALLDGAPFKAQLTKSLILNAGTGSPTFTRATTATFTDFEGVLRTAIAGEARFQGARRVANLVTSQDMTGAGWASAFLTPSYGATAPDGTATATTLTATASNQVHGRRNLTAITGGGVFIVQGKIKRGTVNYAFLSITDNAAHDAHVVFDLVNGSASSVAYVGTKVASAVATITVDPRDANYWKCTLLATVDPTINTYYIYGPANGSAASNYSFNAAGTENVIVAEPQVENVTGQSVQTAGEYVSVGVLSAPYHGAGVDGVKYFDTTLAGVPISSSTLKGYLSEGSRQNLLPQSNAFTTTWTETTAGDTETQNATGIDGATSAWSFIPDGTNALHGLTQTITKAASATQYTFSLYAKASGYNYLVFRFDVGGGNGVWCAFNLSNGTVDTAATLAGTGWTPGTAAIESASNGFYRCSCSFTTDASASLRVIALVANATGSNPFTPVTFAGNTTSGIIITASQLEAAAFASTYIPTTTVAVTRNADVLTYPKVGNILGTAGWAYCEVTPYVNNATANNYYLSTGGGGTLLYSNGTDGNSVVYDGTNAALKGGTTFVNILFKCASSWGSSGLLVTNRGQTPATTSFVGDMAPANISVGYNGASAVWGTIRNVRISTQALSATQLATITS